MEKEQDQQHDGKENTLIQICSKRSMSRSGMNAELTAIPYKRC